MLGNHRNHPEKVFQAAHKSRDCTQSIWITLTLEGVKLGLAILEQMFVRLFMLE